ncbi:hypothetical protein UlMin_035302 [Ulmus minor]
MVKSRIFPLLCVLLISNLNIASPIGTDIFILAGQSNMAGRGGVYRGRWDHNTPPECKPNPNIIRLNAELKWVEAQEPLHADIDTNKTCGLGPGMAFGNKVLQAMAPSRTVVGLVPCAIGGTKISLWARGTPLYDQMVLRAWESIKKGGEIRAILWYQGESDTVRKEDAEAYKGNLKRLINDIRSDLNIPNLLIIQVGLASGEGKYVNEVRKAQKEINLPNVKYVDAKGLRLEKDNLHLTTMSEVHLGIKLANAYLGS